jgi:hypothetical protein
MKEAGERGAYGFLTNTTPYATYIEYGTSAHDIWPKEGHGFIGPTRRGQSRRARTDIGTRRVALRFEIGGRIVFRRMVHHPGNAPMPFMQPASEYAGFVIVRVMENEVIPRVAEIWT